MNSCESLKKSTRIILSEKDEYSIFIGFLDCLSSLADKDKQINAWINGDTSSYTSFSEIYMCFSDACEPILTWPELSKKQNSKLLKLYNMVEQYDKSFPADKEKTEAEICNDPEWDKIRSFAKVIYEELKDVEFKPE